MSQPEVKFDARAFVLVLMSRENPDVHFFFSKEEPNILRYELKQEVLFKIIEEARKKSPGNPVIQGMIELRITFPNVIDFNPEMRTIEIELGDINYTFEFRPA